MHYYSKKQKHNAPIARKYLNWKLIRPNLVGLTNKVQTSAEVPEPFRYIVKQYLAVPYLTIKSFANN